jgi:hypothetical protein
VVLFVWTPLGYWGQHLQKVIRVEPWL